MSGSLVTSSAVMALAVISSQVIWSYLSFTVVFAAGLATIFLRGEWQKARRLEKFILFGVIFYAAPVAAFGTEHFAITDIIASMVPPFIPWHKFWAYFVGACFIAAAFSMVTKIQARLSSTLLALTFFLFVVLMDVPGWIQDPHNRFAFALALRELSFSAGALAFSASLTESLSHRSAHIRATIARYFIAVTILVYSFEQFRHSNYVPAIPLDRLTPSYAPGHAIWTYIAAAVYAVGGTFLLVGKKTRSAATWLGLTVFVVELFVYLPIAIADRATLVGLNYMADTLMFCGAVLLLAGAMPREA